MLFILRATWQKVERINLAPYAAVLAGLTFSLLILGGLVHNTRSSLACPDWPLCYGQMMPKMEGGVLVEHSHRMLATAIGWLTVGLALSLFAQRRHLSKSLPKLGVLAVVTVVIQAVLGGITVLYRLPTWVSTAHLGVSMLFFALLLYIAVKLFPKKPALADGVSGIAMFAAGLVYLQLLVGAYMRHAGAGLACLEWPLCRDALFPADGNFYLSLHMMHRLLGVLVLVVAIWTSIVVSRAATGRPMLRVLAVALPFLVMVQLVLGILSITTFLAVVPVTLHLAVAATIFANLIVITSVAAGEGTPA